ncbi:alpha/beta hydrolase family protein, partial [Flavobacterium sp. LBUM151]
MTKIILALIAVLTSLIMRGQEIAGRWNGLLKIQGKELRIVFNISKTQNGLSATMDSPNERTGGIPVTTITFENSVLKLEIKNSGITYEGTLNKDEIIIGNFKQNDQNIALDLSHYKVTKEIKATYQEPEKPYPYYTEDVIFENKIDNVILEGTLSLPQKEGNFPVLILISGYGKQSRDKEYLGHKSFLVIGDYLTKKGIGVLRFDDRGAGKSTGDYSKATTADFSKDVEAGVDGKIKEQDSTKKHMLVIHWN